MVLGGRIVGQGQNIGGNEAAALLKISLLEALQSRQCSIEVAENDRWVKLSATAVPAAFPRFRANGRLICDFAGGGNRPDIRLELDGADIALGEVKGRKDLSNAWESWMPQVADHMRTWTHEHPQAARLFFATLITDEMIEGRSRRGGQRAGLKQLHEGGFLNAAYNLGKLADKDPTAVASFERFADALYELIQ
jgi:hypothetical protein